MTNTIKRFIPTGSLAQNLSERLHAKPKNAIAVELDAYRARHGYEVCDQFPGIAPKGRPRLAVRKRLIRLAKMQAMYGGKGHSMHTAHIAAISAFPTWVYSIYGISTNGKPMVWYRDNYLEVGL